MAAETRDKRQAKGAEACVLVCLCVAVRSGTKRQTDSIHASFMSEKLIEFLKEKIFKRKKKTLTLRKSGSVSDLTDSTQLNSNRIECINKTLMQILCKQHCF